MVKTFCYALQQGEFWMDSLISIIIPVYNRENVIEECISSIISQSYQNFEIILIDDGSSDNTLEICEKLAKNENRIKILAEQHGGVSAARNKGIDISKGEYVFFLDSDDIIHPHLLETLITAMKNNNAQISGTEVLNVSEHYWHKVNEKITQNTSVGETEYLSHEETLEAVFNRSTPLSLIGGVMMRRDLISDTRFRADLFIGEDFYFIYENLIKGASSVFLKQKWYYCRIHRNNSSNNYDFSAFWTRFYRRELVWKSEESLGRTKYATTQKLQAVGIYMKCILKNKPGSEDYIKMRKVLKDYKKEFLPYFTLKQKSYYYLCYYMPFTLSKALSTRQKFITKFRKNRKTT